MGFFCDCELRAFDQAFGTEAFSKLASRENVIVLVCGYRVFGGPPSCPPSLFVRLGVTPSKKGRVASMCSLVTALARRKKGGPPPIVSTFLRNARPPSRRSPLILFPQINSGSLSEPLVQGGPRDPGSCELTDASHRLRWAPFWRKGLVARSHVPNCSSSQLSC